MCLSLSLLVIIVIAVLLVNYFRKSNAESKKAIEALAQLHKAENDIKTVQNDADEFVKPQFRNPTNSLRSLRPKPPRMQILLFKLAFCHILTDMGV